MDRDEIQPVRSNLPRDDSLSVNRVPDEDNCTWVDGALDDWWEQLIWSQQAHDIVLRPWWMREARPVETAGGWTTSYDSAPYMPFRMWHTANIGAAYPALAPYSPIATTIGEYALDPWAAQMYYSVWW